MGKNPSILKECTYLGNTVISPARDRLQAHNNNITKITFSFYIHKETDELLIKQSTRSTNISGAYGSSRKQGVRVDREMVSSDIFAKYWFYDKWYSSEKKQARLDKLVEKVPKLKGHLAVFFL